MLTRRDTPRSATSISHIQRLQSGRSSVDKTIIPLWCYWTSFAISRTEFIRLRCRLCMRQLRERPIFGANAIVKESGLARRVIHRDSLDKLDVLCTAEVAPRRFSCCLNPILKGF
jgi:hypothetical protein